MTNQIRRAVVAGLAAAVLAWTAAEAQPNQFDAEAERLDRLFDETLEQGKVLDEKMFEHLTHLPDKFELEDEEKRIRRIAEQAEVLDTLGVKLLPGPVRMLLSDGSPSPLEAHRLELSARAPFSRVHVLMVWLQLATWRLAELENLHLAAQEDGTVAFTARVLYPAYVGWPEGHLKQRPWGSTEDMLRDAVRQKELTLELLEGLSARSQMGRLVDALVLFGREMEGQAVGLTELRWDGGKAVLQGVLLGRSAADGFRPALEKVGFVVEDVQTSPTGKCQAFTATAGLKPAERSEQFDTGNGLFEHATAAFCEPVPPAAGRVTARGNAPAGRALTFHLRDFEMVDVFILLNELTSESFLLDEDVQGGRISLDVEGATLEETLAALGSAGVAVGPGPVRRVTRAGTPVAAPRTADYSSEAMDIQNRKAALSEVLCVLSHAAQRPILAPPDLQGTVTLYGTNLRLDQVIEALVTAAGHVSVVDGDRLLLGRGTEAEIRGRKDLVEVCKIPVPSGGSAPSSRLRSLSPTLEKLAASDLELTGLVREGDAWRAFVLTPTRALRVLKTGERLSDASVSAVGPEGLTLANGDPGAVSLKLQP